MYLKYFGSDKIIVVEVYENSPAFKAGLMANDVIVSVDDLMASDSNVSDLSYYIKNEAQDEIAMVIYRDNKKILNLYLSILFAGISIAFKFDYILFKN